VLVGRRQCAPARVLSGEEGLKVAKADRYVVALPLRCMEGGRRWDDPAERWRVYFTDDDLWAQRATACGQPKLGARCQKSRFAGGTVVWHPTRHRPPVRPRSYVLNPQPAGGLAVFARKCSQVLIALANGSYVRERARSLYFSGVLISESRLA